jgi:nitronate monooxygenase
MTDLHTALTKRLNIRHPVILAPMASSSGGAMAAAVTEAGGLGLIGGGYGDPAWLEAQYAHAGNTRVGVGFITWALAEHPEMLTQALDREPAAIMLSFGDHTPYVDALKRAGVPLICQVQTLEQAIHAARTGADVIVAQGQEAGGHGMSARGTMTLVPAIVDAVDDGIPVVAAGGIADGRGLAAALMLGAGGVLMGTRFCAARESLWPDAMKTAVTEAKGDDTVRTEVFDMVRDPAWPAPYDGRAVRNTVTERWHGNEAALRETLDAERARYTQADARGDLSVKVLWAGEGVDLIHDVPPAGEIVERTVAQAVAMLTGGSTYALAAGSA